MRTSLVIQALCIVAMGCSQPTQTFRDLKYDEVVLRAQEYNIRAETSKPVYVEGESIYLKIFIEVLVDSPQTRLSWTDSDGHIVYLEKSGALREFLSFSTSRVQIPPYDATDSTCFFPVGGVREITRWPLGSVPERQKDEQYRKSFGSMWPSKPLETTHSRLGLLPGLYRGFVDLGVTSEWFEFEVVEATERQIELRLIFPRLNNIQDKTTDKREFALRALNFFAEQHAQTPMRCEGLRDGLSALLELPYSTKKRTHATFTQADSTRIVELAKMFAEDCPCHSRLHGWPIADHLLLYGLMKINRPEWDGLIAYGAYLNEIGDARLLEHFRYGLMNMWGYNMLRRFGP